MKLEFLFVVIFLVILSIVYYSNSECNIKGYLQKLKAYHPYTASSNVSPTSQILDTVRISWQHLVERKNTLSCYWKIVYYENKKANNNPAVFMTKKLKESIYLNYMEQQIDIKISQDMVYFFKLYVYLRPYIQDERRKQYKLETSASNWTRFTPCCLKNCTPYFRRKPTVRKVWKMDWKYGKEFYAEEIDSKTEVLWSTSIVQYPSCIDHYLIRIYRQDTTKSNDLTTLRSQRLSKIENSFSMENSLDLICGKNLKYAIEIVGLNNKVTRKHWIPPKCNNTLENFKNSGEKLLEVIWMSSIKPFSNISNLWTSILNSIAENFNYRL